MIPEETISVTKDGNLDDLEVRTSKYGFDEEAIEPLMDLLTDNYSDPMAFVRELSTNAADSHIEAGKADQPIEVTLPTSMVPEFKVQDYGTGLSPDDTEAVFTLYGRSTKRNSNLYNGMLGIGSKSPLAYADSFVVVSRKDGKESTLIIARDEEGVGSSEMLVEDTTEADGVTVMVPVDQKDVERVRNFAHKLFKHWTSPVLVDGHPPTQELDGGFVRVSDELAIRLRPSHYSSMASMGSSTVVMGNVPYRVPDDRDFKKHILKNLDQYLSKKVAWRQDYEFDFTMWVPMGAVSFAPSREVLKSNKKTLDCIKAITEYVAEYGARMVYEWHQTRTIEEVLKEEYLPHNMELLWHNKPTPKYQTLMDEYEQSFVVQSERRHDHTSIYTMPPGGVKRDEGRKVVRLTGFIPKNRNKVHMKRVDECIRKDLDLNDYDTYLLLVNGPTPPYLLEEDLVLDWEDVKKRTRKKKKPKTPRERLIKSYGYRIVGNNGPREFSAADADPNLPLCWLELGKNPNWQFIRRTQPDLQVVTLYSKEKASFLREFPTATTYQKAVDKILKSESKKLTYKDLFFIYGPVVSRNGNLFPDYKGMRDVRLRRALETSAAYHNRRSPWKNLEATGNSDLAIAIREAAFADEKVIEKLASKPEWRKFIELRNRVHEKYPLIRYAEDKQQVIEYVNAMHKHWS